VLTTLTTAFCIDFLGMDDHSAKEKDQNKLKRTRVMVHIAFSVILFGTIVLFRNWNNEAVITQVFVAANFTYGPLIGLFAFSMFTKFKVYDKLVPVICIIPPVACFFLNANSKEWFGGYQFGNELLILNGLLTFAGLMLLINRKKELAALSGLVSLGALAGYSYKKSKYYRLLELKNQLKNELIKNCKQQYVESFLNKIANDIFSSAYSKNKNEIKEQLKKLNRCNELVIDNTRQIKPEITSIIHDILEFKN
jgi:hypothetical protein